MYIGEISPAYCAVARIVWHLRLFHDFLNLPVIVFFL